MRQYGEPQADTKGPGWLMDERGRAYRDEKGTRVYRRIEERDQALDETYRLSPVVRILMGCTDGRAVAMHVCTQAQALAELFWREMPTTAGIGVDTKFSEWCVKNFGRELETAARGVLWGEVRAREVGATTRTLALYESYAEQQRYERAASEMGPYTGGEDEAINRVEAIVEKATGKRLDAKMPKPLSTRQWEARKKLLLEQARRLEKPDPELVPR